jgi:hypothetical protein
MKSAKFKAGDWVVYRKQKTSRSPGPRARETRAARKGDFYNYVVDKYWVVGNVLDGGQVELRTRRGKQHVVPSNDPRLRKAHWWERLMHAARFRSIRP